MIRCDLTARGFLATSNNTEEIVYILYIYIQLHGVSDARPPCGDMGCGANERGTSRRGSRVAFKHLPLLHGLSSAHALTISNTELVL
jgi:hypothetical protein